MQRDEGVKLMDLLVQHGVTCALSAECPEDGRGGADYSIVFSPTHTFDIGHIGTALSLRGYKLMYGEGQFNIKEPLGAIEATHEQVPVCCPGGPVSLAEMPGIGHHLECPHVVEAMVKAGKLFDVATQQWVDAEARMSQRFGPRGFGTGY